MSTDPIVEELHRLRAEQMARVDFDFEVFYRDLKEQEKQLPNVLQAPPRSQASARRSRSASLGARR